MFRLDYIERQVSSVQWQPYHGFHDEHRGKDRTPEYRPAVQQSREEFYTLLAEITAHSITGYGHALQLGVGPCSCSHWLWHEVFEQVVSIDLRQCLVGSLVFPGADTHSPDGIKFASRWAQFDFLFIDAGHKYKDVEQDYYHYSKLLKPGGIVAFHDALERLGYEDEIEVHQFLHTLPGKVNMIGTEIGTAWIVKE